ncbi:MAG: hypothetical protein FIB04_04435 [Gammaproteobacteria bacterium]|nr:hypothetical protein [Gammaproteobacteria bacterium]
MTGLPTADRAALVPWFLASAAAVILLSWWLAGRPVDLPAAGHPPLQCVSYAPSTSSSVRPEPVTREHLRRDLALLARQFSCVRTYSVSDGLDQVPSIARELGIKVLLGAWIGGDELHNEKELRRTIDVARANRDVIEGVVVGNEVLLRHELTQEQLARLIERVRAATGLPVTYADVWGFWAAHRSLADSVSFVTIHVLPYWDDHPVAGNVVIPYVEALYAEMSRLFPGKRVLIGETGWPSAGRPRGGIEPSRVNQARYLREFTALAERRGIPYNLIEAFDQPWKRGPEGTVGGYWGLRDAAGHEKFSWSGPVVEAPQWRIVVVVAAMLGAIGAIAGLLLARERRAGNAVTLASALVLAAGIGAHQVGFLHASNISWTDWTATCAIAIAGWLALAFACRRAIAPVGADNPMPRWIVILLLASCAYACIGLVFAGRHRDFPVWLFLPAMLGLAAHSWLQPARMAARFVERRATEETLLAFWLVLAGVMIPLIEGLANRQAIAWGLVSAVLGLSVLLPLARHAGEYQRGTDQAQG